MKKIINVIVVLFLALSFYGCKNDVCTASINTVCYTKDDPEVNGLSGILRESTIYHSHEYYLVVDFHQPDLNVTALVLQYESAGETKEVKYTIIPKYEYQISWWEEISWTIQADESNKKLRFYLEDKNGHRSSPYILQMDLCR